MSEAENPHFASISSNLCFSAFAERIVIHAHGGKRYAFVGTDLEPVTQHACHSQRCEERCTPAYVRTLEHFGLADPQEEEVTCSEPDEHAVADPPSRVPTALPS